MADLETAEVVENVQDEPTGEVQDTLSGEPVDEIPAGAGPEDETSADAEVAAAPAISDALIGRARDYGLSQNDLEGLDDPRLETIFAAIDRGRMAPAPTAPPVDQIVPRNTPTAASIYAPLKLELGDDLDESVMKPFQSVAQHVNDQMKEMHSFRDEVRQELQALNLLREVTDFDGFISSLGEEWNPDYGVGSFLEMDQSSREFKKRMDVYNGARSLITDAAQRRQPMSLANAHLRSHRAVNWDRIAEIERNKINGKVAKRRQGFSERPTRAKPSALSPRDEAVRAFQ